MADARDFKRILSSSRLIDYTKGQDEDLNNKKIADKKYNMMTSSYDTKEYLEDSLTFGVTAPLIYQLDLLKDDVDDLHAYMSESKYDNKDIEYGGAVTMGSLKVTDNITFGGTAITSTAAELNKLDGFTGDKDDLIYAKDLKATGVTSTEFNTLDGVGSTALSTQLSSKLATTGGTITGAIGNRVNTFGNGDDTPTVKNGNLFKTKNEKALKVTAFDDAVDGQTITVIFGDSVTTFVHGGGKKKGDLTIYNSTDWTGATGDTIQFVYDGSYWYEICRSDNTKK